MDSDPVFELFDEYATAYARGERPRVAEYLDRAGPGADELSRLLDRFLVAAPRREPDAQALAIVGSWLENEPPLIGLRVQRGIKVDAVVKQLVGELGLDAKKADKVKRLYQRLEGGLLEPSKVSSRVWDALGGLLGPGVKEARGWRPGELRGAAAAFYRRADAPVAQASLDLSPPMAAKAMRMEDPRRVQEPDEIDRLFGVA